ncbi:MAG TPA: TonB-dependent receptor [Rhizomicrobium sp.]|nr:TonB-dependent receptor [Rhizomicrobium sp.]
MRRVALQSTAIAAVLAFGGTGARAQTDTNGVETITVIGKAMYVAPSAAPLDATQPTSVVDKGFIQNNIIPLASYDDVIKFEPSVWDQSPNGPGLGKFETLSIRGFQDSSGQYNVTFDGIPFGDTTDLHHTSSALFISHDLSSAEVDRGPGGGATIGKATFGGTVGFQTKTPQDDFSINPYATYGSFNTAAGGVELNTGDTGAGKGFIDFQHEATDGYLSYSAENRTNLMGKYVWVVDPHTTITALATYNYEFQYTTQGATAQNVYLYGRNFALTDNPDTQGYYKYNGSNYYSDFEYFDITHDYGGGWHFDEKVYSDSFTHNYIEGKDATDDNVADNSLQYYKAGSYPLGNAPKNGAKTTDIPGKFADASYRAYGDITRLYYDSGLGEIQAGVWIDEQVDNRFSATIDLSDDNALVPGKYGTPYSYNYHTNARTYQPFFEFDWNVFPNLTLTPGVKYTFFDRDSYGPQEKGTNIAYSETDNYHSLQPAISALYTFDENWTGYIQAAKGFQTPPTAVFQDTLAPDGLKPETTWNYQIGSTKRSDWYTITLDAYYIDFYNYFAQYDNTVLGETQYENAGGAVYKGIEGEGQLVLGSGFSLYANGSINSAKYDHTNVSIADAPDYTAAIGVLYDEKEGPYASIISKAIGPRWGLDNDQISASNGQFSALDQYRFGTVMTVDVAAGYRFSEAVSWMSNLTLSVKIGNLLDNRQFVDFAGFQAVNASTPTFWLEPGRSAFVNLSADLP